MDLSYTIKRSSGRKKLTITVERDKSVVVHAPLTASEEKIRKIVESKKFWIYEKTSHPQKYRDLPHPPGKELVNGESILYLGQIYKIETDYGSSIEIRFEEKFLIPVTFIKSGKDVLRNWYMERAKDVILPRVSNYAKHLGVGYTSANIVDNRYTWGTCTPKDRLNFNWRLIKAL